MWGNERSKVNKPLTATIYIVCWISACYELSLLWTANVLHVVELSTNTEHAVMLVNYRSRNCLLLWWCYLGYSLLKLLYLIMTGLLSAVPVVFQSCARNRFLNKACVYCKKKIWPLLVNKDNFCRADNKKLINTKYN